MAVGSVVNAVAILRYLATSERQGVNAIARAVAISPSSCFNILRTLADEGFVDFDLATKHYSLSSEPARLFRLQTDLSAWATWVEDGLAKLAAEFAVTSGLWQLTGRRVLLVQVAESERTTRIHLAPGQRLPAYIGALGRCVAAAQGLCLDAVTERITALRWQQPPEPADYWAGMQDALRRGWTIDEGNYLKGVTTIAAAIKGANGVLSHCLTSTMFSGQHEPQLISTIGDRTALLAKQASERLAAATRSADHLNLPHSAS